METIINISVTCFTLLVIIFVEKLMYSKVISEQKIADYQKFIDDYNEVLDKMGANAKREFNLKRKHDSLTEIMQERKQAKSFTLIFSGIFLVFVLTGLAFFISVPLTSIGFICTSGIILICYGLIKIAESKKFAVAVLIFVFVLGTGMMILFDNLMKLSLYTYFYLCGIIVLIFIFRHQLLPKPKVQK